MPWKETGPMEERMRFVLLRQDGWAVTHLCEVFGVSRKTGYKWLERYEQDGLAGFREGSRAPHRHPNAVAAEIEAAIVQLKLERTKRGPKKLLDLLQRRQPEVRWPVPSTIGAILKRHGLVRSRRRCRKTPPYEQPFAGLDQPNAVWSADLKGWFLTGDGQRCDPLTITDNYSRYLIRCQAVRPTSFEAIQPVFVGAFHEYGLPEAIRTDNGPPFASTTLGGLSQLSIWWLKLGIVPERIKPGKPQQNGRHERMHRTLKDEAISPPKSTWSRQQVAFDLFRQEFNHERPHEALGQRFPGERYVPSPRPYPLILPEITYPDDMQVRWVKHQGDIKWKGHHVYLTATLAGELVGLRQTDNDLWDIYFGSIRLTQLDTERKKLIHLPIPNEKN
ncbi:MAG: IS481 family transposase [candidate division Zixibacteria bacterium]|nr:IS481 family transposase [candidate division Zixibacteria bacterium]